MGNFFTDTIAKIAHNVTQSVISALIVTLITTYVLVDLGKKKDEAARSARVDTTKQVIIVPILPAGPAGSGGAATSQQQQDQSQGKSIPVKGTQKHGGLAQGPAPKGPHTATGSGAQPPPAAQQNAVITKPVQEAGITPALNQPAKQETNPAAHEVQKAADDALREEKQAVEKVQQRESRARSDTADVRKKPKDVKKRADDIFDERDKEAGQSTE